MSREPIRARVCSYTRVADIIILNTKRYEFRLICHAESVRASIAE